jgi:outer membrane receptor for ferrienterochelin and colicin
MVKLVGHRQQMKFGQRNYTGNQNMLHTNFIYQSILGNTNRTFKTGVSYYLDNYNETFLDTNLLRTESVPGVFGEYTHNFVPEKYIVVAGIRYDNHNLFGHFVSPRIHSKLDVNNVGVFRFSAGRGYRVSNILTENASLLVSSRVVNIQEALQPEVGWTYGASFKKDMTILKKDVDLNIDFFRTDFENQIVVDMETPGKLLFYNLQGNSFSNVAQADLEIEWIKNLSTRFSYKWQEVKTTYRGVLEDVPFVPTHRGMINIAYETPNEKWVFDLTSQIIGQSRLPFIFNPITQQANPLQSPTYSLYNAQVTYKAKKIEYYIGAENLLDYRQANPIVNPGQPFSESFDASQIWAPIFGRMIYGGLRFTLAKK